MKIKEGLRWILLIIIVTQLTACWNYREVEHLSIVTGFSIDQDAATDQYIITAEVIEMTTGGVERRIGTKLISCGGKTMFDAARNLISVSGNRLYWSHAKIFIISQEIAEKGLIPALDFIHHDSEVRNDIDILVAEGKASSIFLDCHPYESGILSHKISETLMSQKSLSKASNVKKWKFINDIMDVDQAAIVPLIRVIKDEGKKIPEVMGTGIVKGDRVIGYLNGDETKTLLLILNKIKGGLLVLDSIYKNSDKKVALEIFKNKTKIKPRILNNKILLIINLQTEVTLVENTGEVNFNKAENLKKVIEAAETEQEKKIYTLIKKVQKEYDADIFGFGKAIRMQEPKAWDLFKKDWASSFTLIETEVKSEIRVNNTGFLAKPIKAGESN